MEYQYLPDLKSAQHGKPRHVAEAIGVLYNVIADPTLSLAETAAQLAQIAYEATRLLTIAL